MAGLLQGWMLQMRESRGVTVLGLGRVGLPCNYPVLDASYLTSRKLLYFWGVHTLYTVSAKRAKQ